MGVVSGGGGGGKVFVPTAIGLVNGAATDVHAVGSHPIKWTSAFDPATSSPVTSVPAALGLSIDLTGVSGDIIATSDGVWSFSLLVVATPDASIKLGATVAATALQLGPVDATDGSTFLGVSAGGVSTGTLAAATSFSAFAETLAAATANPYTIYCQLTFVRLA